MKAVSLAFVVLFVGLTGCKANPCNKIADCCTAVRGMQGGITNIGVMQAQAACGGQGALTSAGNKDACSSMLTSLHTMLGGSSPAACNP